MIAWRIITATETHEMQVKEFEDVCNAIPESRVQTRFYGFVQFLSRSKFLILSNDFLFPLLFGTYLFILSVI